MGVREQEQGVVVRKSTLRAMQIVTETDVSGVEAQPEQLRMSAIVLVLRFVLGFRVLEGEL